MIILKKKQQSIKNDNLFYDNSEKTVNNKLLDNAELDNTKTDNSKIDTEHGFSKSQWNLFLKNIETVNDLEQDFESQSIFNSDMKPHAISSIAFFFLVLTVSISHSNISNELFLALSFFAFIVTSILSVSSITKHYLVNKKRNEITGLNLSFLYNHNQTFNDLTNTIFSPESKPFWLSQIKWYLDNTDETIFVINNKNYHKIKILSYINEHFDKEDSKIFISSLLAQPNSFFVERIQATFKTTNLSDTPPNYNITTFEPQYNAYLANASVAFEYYNQHYDLLPMQNVFNIKKTNNLATSSFILLSFFSLAFFQSYEASFISHITLFFLLSLIVYKPDQSFNKYSLFLNKNEYKKILMNYSHNSEVSQFIKNNEFAFYNTFVYLAYNQPDNFKPGLKSYASKIVEEWKQHGLTVTLTQDIIYFINKFNLHKFFKHHISTNCSNKDTFDRWIYDFKSMENFRKLSSLPYIK